MLNVFIRTTIIFTALILVMRLLGKRQIGEMQPFEFTITLIVADLACLPLADTSIPLIYGIVAILAVFVLHQLLFLLEQSGDFMRKVISGKPSVVVTKNGVDLKELKKNNLDIEDLIESMRSQGFFSLDDIDYAIFESNGKLSALPKQNHTPTSSLPVLLVSSGKINNDNLKFAGFDTDSLKRLLEGQNALLKNTEVLTVDNNGKVYLQEKGKAFKTFNVDLREGAEW